MFIYVEELGELWCVAGKHTYMVPLAMAEWQRQRFHLLDSEVVIDAIGEQVCGGGASSGVIDLVDGCLMLYLDIQSDVALVAWRALVGKP